MKTFLSLLVALTAIAFAVDSTLSGSERCVALLQTKSIRSRAAGDDLDDSHNIHPVRQTAISHRNSSGHDGSGTVSSASLPHNLSFVVEVSAAFIDMGRNIVRHISQHSVVLIVERPIHGDVKKLLVLFIMAFVIVVCLWVCMTCLDEATLITKKTLREIRDIAGDEETTNREVKQLSFSSNEEAEQPAEPSTGTHDPQPPDELPNRDLLDMDQEASQATGASGSQEAYLDDRTLPGEVKDDSSTH